METVLLMTSAAGLQGLLAHYRAMPPVAGMGIEIDHYDGRGLRLFAPLSRHVNDKGCGFGGSLTSLMTLAGWGLVTLQAEAAGVESDVFVADSQVDYVAPLYADLRAEARLEPGTDWVRFADRLRERGRTSIHLQIEVALPEGGVATRGRARYVAIARR